MKIQFSKLEIQYDPEKMGNEILKITLEKGCAEMDAALGSEAAAVLSIATKMDVWFMLTKKLKNYIKENQN